MAGVPDSLEVTKFMADTSSSASMVKLIPPLWLSPCQATRTPSVILPKVSASRPAASVKLREDSDLTAHSPSDSS